VIHDTAVLRWEMFGEPIEDGRELHYLTGSDGRLLLDPSLLFPPAAARKRLPPARTYVREAAWRRASPLQRSLAQGPGRRARVYRR
jgi:hypothetical protein